MQISEAWWQFLLSGLIASVIGGGIAALVATLVLRRTNYHQSNLALAAITEHRRLADLETKRQDARALTQLRELKMEASKERELSAIAEVLSIFGQGIPQLGISGPDQLELSGPELERLDLELFGRLGAAISRWGIEATGTAIGTDVYKWPQQWRHSVNKVRDSHGSADHYAQALKDHAGMMKLMIRLARGVYSDTDENRIKLMAQLQARRSAPGAKSASSQDIDA